MSILNNSVNERYCIWNEVNVCVTSLFLCKANWHAGAWAPSGRFLSGRGYEGRSVLPVGQNATIEKRLRKLRFKNPVNVQKCHFPSVLSCRCTQPDNLDCCYIEYFYLFNRLRLFGGPASTFKKIVYIRAKKHKLLSPAHSLGTPILYKRSATINWRRGYRKMFCPKHS